ncbi:MAG: hypothetical protein JWO42_2837 [Chloroflexi bacterium]|nr:hypothetical protein [Chloroflexota bacterium]
MANDEANLAADDILDLGAVSAVTDGLLNVIAEMHTELP